MMRRAPRAALFPDATLFRAESPLASRRELLADETVRLVTLVYESAYRSPIVETARLHRFHLVTRDRKSTRLNSSHANISYAVFCLKKKISLSQRVTLIAISL